MQIPNVPLPQTTSKPTMQDLKPSPPNASPLTPLGFLERAATVYGDSPSVVYNDTVYTWSQTHRRCLQLASSLTSIGIRRGQVVSVVAPNVPSMYELQFAVPMSGAVLNNLNTRLDPRTLSVLLHHSESKLVFVDSQYAALLRDAVSLLPPDRPHPKLVLLSDEADTTPSPPHFFSTYDDLVQKGDPNFKWAGPLSEWDPMVLNYTSGTTSSPKGVVHCHRGLYLMSLATLVDWGVPKQPVYLWTLPIFHANGWSFPWGMAAVGGTNICVRRFDGATIRSLIDHHGVTHMCAAPVVLNMLTTVPNAKPLRNPVHVMTAGAPPPPPVLSRTEALGFRVLHGFGMTEAAGTVVSCAWKARWDALPDEERARLKARQGVGIAGFAGVDVVNPATGESVDRDGSTLGEVVLRGGSIMLGYLKDPEATSKCMNKNDDGWFYTGDVGVMHPDGYLQIKDRSKDVIISGGENINSVEVESVLYANSAVNEAAVVARPDEYWGETPCAFVSLKLGVDKKPTEKEVIEFCRKRLPHYMVPKTVVFRDELPKTSTGKIKKFVLREIARSLGSSKLSRL